VKFLPAAKYIKKSCSCPVEFCHYTRIHCSFYYYCIPYMTKLLKFDSASVLVIYVWCTNTHKCFTKSVSLLTMKTDRVLSKPEYIKCCSTTKDSSWMFKSIDKAQSLLVSLLLRVRTARDALLYIRHTCKLTIFKTLK